MPITNPPEGEISLPELPVGEIDVYFNGQRTDPAFSAEQVRAYARTAILADRARSAGAAEVLPLTEPVTIAKAMRAHRKAEVWTSVGASGACCVGMVNIQIEPWNRHTPKEAQAFANGFNLAAKWMRDSLATPAAAAPLGVPAEATRGALNFSDPDVQRVYDFLCADAAPPAGEHWEGWVARRVVASLRAAAPQPETLAPVAAQVASGEAIDMVLHCPACGLQHIDAPEGEPHLDVARIDEDAPDGEPWINPPHRSHLCHGCGNVWRPADVPTNGVSAVKTTGKADSPLAAPAPVALAAVGAREFLALIDTTLNECRNAFEDCKRKLGADPREDREWVLWQFSWLQARAALTTPRLGAPAGGTVGEVKPSGFGSLDQLP
jgi:hypothetical protein